MGVVFLSRNRLLRRGAGLALSLCVALVAQVAGAFSYYAPTPQWTMGLSEPTISQQLRLEPGETIKSVDMLLDGSPVKATWNSAGLIAYTPSTPLAAGTHKARLTIQVAPANTAYRYQPLVTDFSFTVAGDAITVLPAPGPEESRALQHANALRAQVGLAPLTYDTPLGAASERHARYLVANPTQRRINPHAEQPGTPLYFGADGGERARFFGADVGTDEVINFDRRAEDAVDGWMDTLYHRLAIIAPGATTMGYGVASGAGGPVNVLLAGLGDRPTAGTVAWPYPGQTGVRTAWAGLEEPDPLRLYPGVQGPVGYTVTLTFGGSPKSLTLTTGTLRTSTGSDVPVMRFDPVNDDQLHDTVSLLPYKPLLPGTAYTVHLAGKVDGAAYDKTWSFTTAPTAVPQVDSRETTYRSDRSIVRIDLSGSGFAQGAMVFLGGLPVSNLAVNSATEMSFAPPVGFTGGPADLLVVNPGGERSAWTGFMTGSEGYKFSAGAAFSERPLSVNGKLQAQPALVHQATGAVLLPESVLTALGAQSAGVAQIGRTYWTMGSRTADYTMGSTAATVNGGQITLAMPVQQRNGTTYVDAALVRPMAGGLVTVSDSQVAVGLADIGGHWAAPQILRLVQAGIVSGGGDGYFRPGDTLTRAAFVKMMVKARGLTPQLNDGAGFVDTAGHWVAQQGFIGAAVRAGIVKAGEYPGGRFEPDRAITREEMAVMVTRALGLDATAAIRLVPLPATVAGKPFSDAATWTRPGYVAVAVEQGIITGYQEQDGTYTFRPVRPATRAEASVMVVRMLDHK